jgi:hypothetical protein
MVRARKIGRQRLLHHAVVEALEPRLLMTSALRTVDDTYTVHQGQTLAVVSDDQNAIMANDDIPNGTAVIYAKVSDPLHGAVELSEDGTFSYTPSAGFVGDDLFMYRVAVDGVESAPAAVRVHVTDTPPAARHEVYVYDGDTWLGRSDHALAANVRSNDFDPDQDPLTFTLVRGPHHGTFAFQANGTFTYLPDMRYHGFDTFVYKASDGALFSNESTVTIHDYPTPVLPPDDVLVDSGSFDPIDLWLGTDAVDVHQSNPENGDLLDNGDGSYTYFPTSIVGGRIADRITYRISAGRVESAFQASIILTQGLNIDEYDFFGTPAYEYNVVLTHDQSASESVQPGYLVSATGDAPAHGTLVVNATNGGGWTYTPAPGFVGWDHFSLMLHDGGPTVWYPIHVLNYTVEVRDTIAQPADNYKKVVSHDTTLTVDAAHGLLAGLSDPDGDPMTLHRVRSPDHGALTTSNDGSYQYTPEAGFVGIDYFSYAIKGVDGTDSPVAVTWIDVMPWNVDVDIDSDNNNGLELPARSEVEDQQEDTVGDPAAPGKIAWVNAGDRDHDGVPD